MIRKILSTVLALVLMLHTNVFADAAYNIKETKPVAGGVVLTNIHRLDSAGWQNINVIEADLNNEYVKADIFTSSKGLNNLETVKTLAEENKTTVSVNGDFFAWNSTDKSKGTVLGTVLKDGVLLSSSSETDGMFTFAIDNFNKLFCESIKTDITLKAANGNELKIKHLNKYDSLAEPVIYTSAFGGVTTGSYNNVLEVVIVDNVVTEMRTEQEGIEVPENGYIIRHLPEFDPFLVENLSVGDTVEIHFNANVDLDQFKTMTGGGTMLVTQGQPAKITHNVAGANPRTVIACDETRTKLYLITIDGRQNNAKGYNLNQLTDFLIEFGVYDAMNLDGGGSTTLVVNDKGQQVVVNKPSDNSLRKVASAIGVISEAPKGKVLSGFEIDINENKVFKGTTKTFEIKNMVDEYGNPFEGKTPEIDFEIEKGYGYFEKNVLHAQKEGKNVKVYAKSGNVVAQCEIDILGDVFNLTVTPSHFNIGEEIDVKVSAEDKDGISASIEAENVSVININNFEKNVVVAGKNKKISFSDIIFDFENTGFSATKYPESAKSTTSSYNKNFKSGKSSARLEYDFSGVKEDESAAAYLNFASPVKVGDKQKLGVWVYSPTVLNQWLRAEFKDENGNVQRQTLIENIDFCGWKYVMFDVPDGAKELTRLYIVQNNLKEKSGGYLLFDSLSDAQYQFDDEITYLNVSESQKGDLTISVVADMPKGNGFLPKILAANVASKVQTSDYVFSLKNYDFNNLEEIKTDGYKSFKKGDLLFITVNNSDGYTSATQWLKFDSDTKGTFKNVFIFLNESPDLIKNHIEQKMFREKIENLSQKGNVYVFYPDYHTATYYQSGAKFVSVGNFNTLSPLSSVKLLNTLSVPQIVIKNNNAEINFVNIK